MSIIQRIKNLISHLGLGSKSCCPKKHQPVLPEDAQKEHEVHGKRERHQEPHDYEHEPEVHERHKEHPHQEPRGPRERE